MSIIRNTSLFQGHENAVLYFLLNVLMSCLSLLSLYPFAIDLVCMRSGFNVIISLFVSKQCLLTHPICNAALGQISIFYI